ncbi:hypothetical protein R1X32_00520 (plasmid) [Rhodococcus opacus]|uniref:hypothetical protein n=1 Tax=Rhodococcus opacus TaxID=37919 RepID=UPI0034D31CC6
MNDWAGADRGEPVTSKIEPGALLKQVAMPGWVEMRLTQINLRTDAAKRFAACTLDRWEGKPDPPAPQDIIRPRSVALHETATSLRAGRIFWTFVAVAISLMAVLFDFGAAAFLVPAVWVCWLVVVPGSSILSKATAHTSHDYHRRVADAEHAAQRRNAPQLSGSEMRDLGRMLTTTEGKLAYAAAVLAAETATSPVWEDPVFDDFHARVDLRRHVGEIAESARALAVAREELGTRPGGTLAADETITELYERRTRELDGRLSVLTQRVHGLLIYRDHVRGFEPLIEKRRWLEAHYASQSGDPAPTSDELGSAELRDATEEIDSRTREAMRFLLHDAERLSRM